MTSRISPEVDTTDASAVSFRTSMFVSVEDGMLTNDLTGTSRAVSNDEVLLLRRLWRKAEKLAHLSADPQSDIRRMAAQLVSEGILVRAEADESSEYFVSRVDIETCRSCNARCVFCPQSSDPKMRGVMSAELFSHLLQRLRPLTLEWVALNHYGEPLLDPLFESRVASLTLSGLAIRLFTNGTLLGPKQRSFLSRANVNGVVVNYPCVEPRRWSELMGMSARLHKATTQNLELLVASQIAPIEIVVNGITADQLKRCEEIYGHFSSFGPVGVSTIESNSRAGAIESHLVRAASCRETRGAGCNRIVRHLHVSWEGKVYLCCQDYAQKYILGDLLKASIAEVMGGDRARRFRSAIYGATDLAAHTICGSCTKLRRERFASSRQGET